MTRVTNIGQHDRMVSLIMQTQERAFDAELQIASGRKAQSYQGLARDAVRLVEMETTPEQRQAGLMFRTEMAPDHGMLFDFGREDDLAFWMKNTPLSLDIIFIRADGSIANIQRKTTPFSTKSLPSDGPARAALELNAGTARALGIKPGDKVRHRIFGN